MTFNNKRGDTIVEVVIAIAMFSIVAIGAQNLMNKSLSTTRGDLEISFVRNEIDSQANALRFMHNAYVASGGNIPTSGPAREWKTMLDYVTTNPAAGIALSSFGLTATGTCPSLNNKSFIINTHKSTFFSYRDFPTKFTSAITYSQVVYDSVSNEIPSSSATVSAGTQGISIQAVTGGSVTNPYTDFHVRACWYTVGQKVPHTLGTIVRLYDPK